MGQTNGVYIMRVASMLTGMHPQTLRKYERAGLLEPSRCKKLRMYSDEDIARLRTIKHLVDNVGLNLAGVKVALQLHDSVLNVRKQLASTDLSANRRKQLLKSLDESLMVLGTVLGHNTEEYAWISLKKQ
ncbi:MAG: MerR family transcriptional regulator [Dehalococcoidales bacterium]|nr:MerR family transcriptional regulator [Dehalococcoidales bacterium]